MLTTQAYPTQVNVPYTDTTFEDTPGYSWGFLACSGATTTQILKSQVTTKPDKTNTNWLLLSSTTTLVTITAGGDDLGWANVLKFCYEQWTDCENDSFDGYSTLNAYANAELAQLEPRLQTLYQAIAALAPNATILVLGYPQLLPASVVEQDCFELRPIPGEIGLDNDEQNWLRSADTALNTTIENAVSASGVDAVFLPVASEFAGHEVCGSLGPWINGPSFTIHGSLRHPSKYISKSSFHPNETGQSEYATLINQFLTPLS
jgi:hypothetical protein